MRDMTPEDYAVSLLDRMLGDEPPGSRRDDILAMRSELLSGTSLSDLRNQDASVDHPLSAEERAFLEEAGWPPPAASLRTEATKKSAPPDSLDPRGE